MGLNVASTCSVIVWCQEQHFFESEQDFIVKQDASSGLYYF